MQILQGTKSHSYQSLLFLEMGGKRACALDQVHDKIIVTPCLTDLLYALGVVDDENGDDDVFDA